MGLMPPTDANLSPKKIAAKITPYPRTRLKNPQLRKYQDRANPMKTKTANIAISHFLLAQILFLKK